MLFTHPDNLLQLAKEHQAKLRREAAVAALATAETGTFRWLQTLSRHIGAWAAAAMKPHWAAEDSIWPKLKDYPYPSAEAAQRKQI